MMKSAQALVLSTAMLAFAGSLAPAQAQTQTPTALCADRASLIEGLNSQYSEKPVARGLDAEGRLMEVLAGPSGSWTLLLTDRKGSTCLVTVGVGWQTLEAAASLGKPVMHLEPLTR